MSDKAKARLVRIAARALGRHGLAHAYGHCSVRLDRDHMLASPGKPLGLTKPGESCIAIPVHGPFPDGLLGELRIHREIYQRRPNTNAIIRCQPPKIISLSALGLTPSPRHGFGAYFWPKPPLWNDPQLLRNDEKAAQLAAMLGEHHAIIMRGNGAVIAGETMQEALTLTWYLEDAARVELDCLSTHPEQSGPILSKEDCDGRAVYSGGILERMWDYLTDGDPENA